MMLPLLIGGGECNGGVTVNKKLSPRLEIRD